MWWMNSFLIQLVAVASSLVLAFPPGWCSGFMRHDRAEPAPAQATCCHRTAHEQPCESKEAPADPRVECCCARDVALPERSVQPTDIIALPLVADSPLADLGLPVRGEAADAPFRSGPRLHVLQCVWRC
jgi:hypothetical protein